MVNYSTIIAESASKNFNVHDRYKNNTVEENQFICQLQRRSFSVGCINVTGDLNVGTMIRSASLMGASNFYIFGRKKFDKRSTVGAEHYINIVQHIYDDPLTADQKILDDLHKLSHPIVACEQGGVTLGTIDAQNVFTSVKDNHPLFLFGSESHGIPKIIIDQLDETECPRGKFSRVSIPQVGVLRSFNVSTAMAIICWDYLKESFL